MAARPAANMPTDLTSLSEREITHIIGIGDPLISPGRIRRDPPDQSADTSLADLTYLTADNRDLRAEVERLRGDRERLLDTQRRIMELLGTTASERLIHDLRNVLNERELFRALADALE